MDNSRTRPARPPIVTNARRQTEVPSNSKKTSITNRIARRGPPPLKPSVPVSKYSVSLTLSSSIPSSISPTRKSASSGFEQFRKNKNMKFIEAVDQKSDISKSKSVETMVSRWGNHPHSEFVSPLAKRTNSANTSTSHKSLASKKYRRPPPSTNYNNNNNENIIEDDIKNNNNDEHTIVLTRQTPIFLPNMRSSMSSPPFQHQRNREISTSSSNAKYGDCSPSSLRVSDTDIEKCKIEHLLSSMNQGSQCLNNFHHALSVFAKQQVSQSEGFLKLFTNSRKNYSKMQSMPNFTFAMEMIHNLLEETLRQQQDFSIFIQNTCLPIISSLNKKCKEKYTVVYNETKKMSKILQNSETNVQNVDKKTQTAAERAVIARQKSEVLYKPPFSSSTQKLNKFKISLNVGTSHNSLSVEESYLNAQQSEKKLKISVAKYNQHRSNFIDSRINGQKEIISTELYRIQSMIGIFQSLVLKQQEITGGGDNNSSTNKLAIIQKDILLHTTTMNAEHIVQSFINEILETHGHWNAPKVKYAVLNVDYRDMFHSISDAMSITLEINPTAKIPLIIPLLCSKIKDLDGFRIEGIFRLSPRKTDIMQMKKRIQVKNFQMDEMNVHVYAVLLKQWMRDLQDLVIPMIYYQYCIDMAMKQKLDAEHFEVFLSQLPSVNREIVKYLVCFLRELISPENVECTKMNLENISIVFGPTLLRPNPELEIEPQQQMLNSKYEKEFVISLIQNSVIN